MEDNKRLRLSFRDCKLRWMNLRGLPTKYNEHGGVREFNIVVDDVDLAQQLIEDGWNIKVKPPRDEDGDPTYELPVEARYNHIPPKIWMITNHGRTLLDEMTVGQLDYADILEVSVIVKGREWEPGKIKAFCRKMYVKIEEDEFEAEYLYDDDEPF